MNATTPTEPRFHVQLTGHDLRDGFPYFAHHDSVSVLWNRKWRPLCVAAVHPFAEAQVGDFDPIFAELVETSKDDPGVLYRPDDYAAPFLPVARRLTDDARSAGRTIDARELFLRAAAVYRVARYPVIRSAAGRHAWSEGSAAYEEAARLLDPPNTAVEIPFTHADASAGDVDTAIPAFLRLPKGEPPPRGWPVVLLISGLDGYRSDLTARTHEHIERGRATLTFEIPGTGDCPAAPSDPTSPDRLLTSVLDWIATNAPGRRLDPDTVIACGLSTGGYYAMRAAHTHADQLFAAVSVGGGCHEMFDAEWIRAQNGMEYPFALAEALAWKFGYRDPDTRIAVERYAAEARAFSLLDAGVLDTPNCRLLVVNGMEDSIFPVEDTILAATRSSNTDLIVLGARAHMGNPDAWRTTNDWIDRVVAERSS